MTNMEMRNADDQDSGPMTLMWGHFLLGFAKSEHDDGVYVPVMVKDGDTVRPRWMDLTKAIGTLPALQDSSHIQADEEKE